MSYKLFRRINSGVAWVVFLLATLTYLFTISHSANLWDTAEFVVCINKLEVGHPPGSPFFMLVYNLATQFASDPSEVATFCNATSAILSGFTILFLYLTITHLVRRLVAPGYRTGKLLSGKEASPVSYFKAIGIMVAGFGGAMLYAFTDTFWYSAVEAEVYAFSSFFTALVFWLMLEWEDRSHQPDSDRWLILIAYCFGLSIGVHLLNLLCLPAMALVFYFRRHSAPSFKGAVGVLLASFALIVVVMYGIIQGSMKVATLFDLFFVNTLSLPFNSGLVFYVLLLLAVGILSLIGFHKKGLSKGVRLGVFFTCILMGIPFISSSWGIWVLLIALLGWWLFLYKRADLRLLYTVQTSLLALFIGFSSYGVIAIRSAAQPPMNENNPSNPVALRKYLNREQYGETPIVYGHSFASRVVDVKERKGDWMAAPKSATDAKDRYVRGPKRMSYRYDQEMLFPRVYSTNPEHISAYNVWMGRHPDDRSQPSFVENLRYFFSYQVNYMYWRYFGWNFVGRQNDLHGHGSMLRGGVATGFNFIDRLAYGDASSYPDEMASNKAHNVYYLMPLLLGILGIAFQLARGSRGAQSFWVVFFFFFMTGLAILVYINQTPFQPRERDYAYAGSFYAFAIWIGLGIAGIWQALAKRKSLGGEALATVVALVVAIAVPLQMLGQNYDDHNRSGRTVASDMGYNFLESCGDNAIVFCFGDNDTFPLWYAQEIEGVKRDARAANLSYMAAEWYVDQMRTEAYESAPLPLKVMTPEFYYKTAFVSIVPSSEPKFLMKELDRVPTNVRNGQYFIEGETYFLPIDSIARANFSSGVTIDEPLMHISLKGKRFLGRDGLVVLDLIRANNWERPIYWLKTTPTNAFSNLPDYLASSGVAWKLYPTNMKKQQDDSLLDHEYDLVMNRFRWFGASGDDVYFDENIRNNIRSLYRGQLIPSLALRLDERGDRQMATDVLLKCFKELPSTNIPYDYSDLNLALVCYSCGLSNEGDTILDALLASSIRGVQWFVSLSPRLKERAIAEGEYERFTRQVLDILDIMRGEERMARFQKEWTTLNELFTSLYGKEVLTELMR